MEQVLEPVTWVVGGSAIVALLAFLFALRGRRKRRERDQARYEEAVSRGELPLTLHPVIDMDRCIGCLTCVKACPEGDILGEVDGKVMLVAPSHCIGHGRCAAECPSDAIKLVIGTAQRGVELPEISEYFESSRPGVHIIGELGGMGLIKNAMTQGVQVSRYLGKQVAKGGGGRNEVSDVLIVGAGPAGLAAALGCREQGLSFRLVDQEKFGGTVANYPRHKLVMSEIVNLPIVGKFGKRSMSKESLMGAWQKIAKRADIAIEEHTKVEGIDGEDGNFAVKSNRGVIRARKVVLATGRRGTPRKLGVPGEELPKVSYRLLEPEQYQGSRVLVVGGGDSAVEAACQIASDCEDVEVAISYRGDGFSRCREANRQKLQRMIDEHRVVSLLGSEVKKITPTHVVLAANGKQVGLRNDFVIVCAGGEMPLQFLQAARIRLERLHGQELRRKAPRVPGKRAQENPEEKRLRRSAFIFFTIGALIVAGLTVVGWDYYRLPLSQRLRSPLHQMLRPAGLWGHGVGVVATLFMLSNFLYAARKRLRFLKGVSSIRRWLLFHQFVGFMSPLVIAFHAAFQSNNLLATATAGSLSIVVGTGLIGRFIYGLVPTRDGRTVEYADVVGRWERMKARVDPLFEMASDPESIREVLELATAPARKAGLVSLFFHLPMEALSVRWRLRRARRFFKHRGDYETFRGTFFQLLTLRRQVGFYVGLKKLLASWRTFHAVLAVFLVVMIAGHIALSLYLGYGWIFM